MTQEDAKNKLVSRLREIASQIENGGDFTEYSENIELEDEPNFGRKTYLDKRPTGWATLSLTWFDVKRKR